MMLPTDAGILDAQQRYMDAIDLLRRQHQDILAAFSEILATDGTDDWDTDSRRRELLDKLANDLIAHAFIEEHIFYPTVCAPRRENQRFLQSLEEHLSIGQLLNELLDMSTLDEDFATKLTSLQEEVAQHVEEEEHALFTIARTELRPDELRSLGLEMAELFEDQLAEHPTERLPTQLALEAALL